MLRQKLLLLTERGRTGEQDNIRNASIEDWRNQAKDQSMSPGPSGQPKKLFLPSQDSLPYSHGGIASYYPRMECLLALDSLMTRRGTAITITDWLTYTTTDCNASQLREIHIHCSGFSTARKRKISFFIWWHQPSKERMRGHLPTKEHRTAPNRQWIDRLIRTEKGGN